MFHFTTWCYKTVVFLVRSFTLRELCSRQGGFVIEEHWASEDIGRTTPFEHLPRSPDHPRQIVVLVRYEAREAHRYCGWLPVSPFFGGHGFSGAKFSGVVEWDAKHRIHLALLKAQFLRRC